MFGTNVMPPAPLQRPPMGWCCRPKPAPGWRRCAAVCWNWAGWQGATEGLYIARERHVQALRRVRAHLDQAQAQLSARVPLLDLLAEELRLAQNALNDITGEFTSDDLLGVIFSSFCIGK
jgi:tRNA U34 5-carboxymethylaminomethyl modifying GTPase MnmE/TrmE